MAETARFEEDPVTVQAAPGTIVASSWWLHRPAQSPCALVGQPLRIALLTVSAGIRCSTQDGPRLSFDAIADLGWASELRGVAKVRPALTITGRFDQDITPSLRLVASAGVRIAQTLTEAQENALQHPGYKPAILQGWLTVWDHALAGHLIWESGNAEMVHGIRLSYRETLPAALGADLGIRQWASVRIKQLSLSYRTVMEGWVLGTGASYVLADVAGVRVGFALPEMFLGYVF